MALVIAASSGAVAAISQSLGAGKDLRARRYVALVVYGCIGFGVTLALAAWAASVPFLRLLHTPDAMLPTATLFLSAYLASLPGQYVLSIGAAVFRAAKSVKKPLYVSLFAAGANIFGDLAFALAGGAFPTTGPRVWPGARWRLSGLGRASCRGCCCVRACCSVFCHPGVGFGPERRI